MTVISVSLSSKLLNEIDNLKEEMGFSGRSEVIRASTRMLIADNRERGTKGRYEFNTCTHPQ